MLTLKNINRNRIMISVCYLDLLYQIACFVRVKPDNYNLVKSMKRATNEIVVTNGIAGKISKSDSGNWEVKLNNIFLADEIDEKTLKDRIFYYPDFILISKNSYDLVVFLSFKSEYLLEYNEREMFIDYMDLIHIIPVAIKEHKFNKLVWMKEFKKFIHKYPLFFSKEDTKKIYNLCELHWWMRLL